MTSSLRVNLLGEFSLLSEGVAVAAVNTTRLQALLAYLLLHRDTPQPRQQIAFLFWPDSSEGQALSNLRNLLHQLRNSWPAAADYIQSDSRTLCWCSDANFSLDVAEFEDALALAGGQQASGDGRTHVQEALQEAVAHYSGDLLPNFYDEWVLTERERLRQKAIAALERLTLMLEEQRDYGPAIGYAQRLLRHDPLDEASYRLLMRLFTGSGNNAGALRVYHNCMTILQRELGVEPSAATRELLARISAAPASDERRQSWSGNIPAQQSSFVGREREMMRIISLLRQPEVRVVTVVGTAGVGKTRLALQVAADLSKSFSDGAFFVPLAAISDPERVLSEISRTLGIREESGMSPLANLMAYLNNKRVLLVLDNFEQVVKAAARIGKLLAGCARLKLLITSRQALDLPGEATLLLAGLPLPPPSLQLIDELAQCDAVALFVERAREARRDFTLTPRNAWSVAEITRRLEGIALAIELAAARIRVLDPETMLERLQNRLQLLTGSARDLPERHETLRNAIAWSYDLLTTDEQRLFRKVGVFVGGWTLSAAEQLAAESTPTPSPSEPHTRNHKPGVLDQLESLLYKSLLQTERGRDDEPRFTILESIREYALEKLQAAGEYEGLLAKHAAYYQHIARNAAAMLAGPEQQAGLDMLDREHDNLLAALDWTLGNSEPQLTAELARTMAHFWRVRGLLNMGRRWFAAALDVLGEAPANLAARAILLHNAGVLAYYQGDYQPSLDYLSSGIALFQQSGDEAGRAAGLAELGRVIGEQGKFSEGRALLEEALALMQKLGDQAGIAAVFRSLGYIAHREGDLPNGEDYYQRSLILARAQGDTEGVARSLFSLGMIAHLQEDLPLAAERYRESQGLYQALQSKAGLGLTTNNLGLVALDQDDLESAGPLLREALRLRSELGDKEATVWSLEALAELSARLGAATRTVLLLGATEALREAIGAPMPAVNLPYHQRTVQLAQAQLAEPTFYKLWIEGRSKTLEDAVEFALQADNPDPAATNPAPNRN